MHAVEIESLVGNAVGARRFGPHRAGNRAGTPGFKAIGSGVSGSAAYLRSDARAGVPDRVDDRRRGLRRRRRRRCHRRHAGPGNARGRVRRTRPRGAVRRGRPRGLAGGRPDPQRRGPGFRRGLRRRGSCGHEQPRRRRRRHVHRDAGQRPQPARDAGRCPPTRGPCGRPARDAGRRSRPSSATRPSWRSGSSRSRSATRSAFGRA